MTLAAQWLRALKCGIIGRWDSGGSGEAVCSPVRVGSSTVDSLS